MLVGLRWYNGIDDEPNIQCCKSVIIIGAILNKHQKGDLYFGVKPDGTPIGQQITEKTLRDISQGIHNHIELEVFPEIHTVMIDGCECIHVQFEGYNTPYFGNNVARIRVADEDRVMSQQELVAYIQKKKSKEESWEKGISPNTVDSCRRGKGKALYRKGTGSKAYRI